MNSEANDIVVEAILSAERQRIGNEIRVMRRKIERRDQVTLEQIALALDVSVDQFLGWQRGTNGPTITGWTRLRALFLDTIRIRPGSWTLQVSPEVQDLSFDDVIADQQVSVGTELRGTIARIKARFAVSSPQLAHAIGVTERLLGYWRNGASAPRIREMAILRCLEASRLRIQWVETDRAHPYLVPGIQAGTPSPARGEGQ